MAAGTWANNVAHPVEEGSGAPSFKPLWRLMPYLWPKGRPDLKGRVIISIFFLILAIITTTISQQFLGEAVDAFGTTPARASMAVIAALRFTGIFLGLKMPVLRLGEPPK